MTHWTRGNRVELLENGETFFPRVFEAIESARTEVLVETFILEDDEVGRALQRSLVGAAARGVRVELTVDAWGSMRLPAEFLATLTSHGVCCHLFAPAPSWRLRVAWFRRLHRKLVVIDAERAFTGGINFAQDQIAATGRHTKLDYAVDVHGPIVADMHAVAASAVRVAHRRTRSRASSAPGVPRPPRAGPATAAFVTRDNRRHRTAIEREYRAGIARARRRLFIANAYFFPGYRLLRGIRQAARRGVDVRLVLQGEPDLPLVQIGASLLYDYLLDAGVRIFEYCPRALHGKVAVVDDEWTTVGSSNLDPLSLALNLEGNLVVRDTGFTTDVAARLESLMADECTEVVRDPDRPWAWWRAAASVVVFHFLRHFPRWAGQLPPHDPVLTPIPPAEASRPQRQDLVEYR